MIYQLAVFACIFILALIFQGLMNLLEGSPFEKFVSAAMLGIFLCLVVGSSWVSQEAARRTVRNGGDPLQAWRSMLDELRLMLSGLPAIGRVFRPRPPKRSPFDGPDDARFL
ncbi:MAG TPA: hypothetical protein VFV75_12130 [Candidatus Polarisedimenticolaceae bacterium]|nr:hypothetical protein [Candidatus Polarisedimenticolaceae bacterium]